MEVLIDVKCRLSCLEIAQVLMQKKTHKDKERGKITLQ